MSNLTPPEFQYEPLFPGTILVENSAYTDDLWDTEENGGNPSIHQEWPPYLKAITKVRELTKRVAELEATMAAAAAVHGDQAEDTPSLCNKAITRSSEKEGGSDDTN